MLRLPQSIGYSIDRNSAKIREKKIKLKSENKEGNKRNGSTGRGAGCRERGSACQTNIPKT